MIELGITQPPKLSKVLVIGDSCLDVYIYCKTNRLAPDKPVPVLEKTNTVSTPGMAFNVFNNVKSLTKSCGIITNSNWEQIIKERYVEEKSNHMFMRVDSNLFVERIMEKSLIEKYESIIISDYNKGFLSEKDIEMICDKHHQVFLDTKKVLGSWASKAKFIKINNDEYEKSKHFIKYLDGKVIRTIGDGGCEYNNSLFPVKKKVEVLDVSGAGDTFLAALCVKFTDTKDISLSIEFANECASEVVQHRGMTTI